MNKKKIDTQKKIGLRRVKEKEKMILRVRN